MSAFGLWRLFHRPSSRRTGRDDAPTSLLAVVAFAASTTIFLTVLGGVHGFVWRASREHTLRAAFSAPQPGIDPMASTYVVLALFACLLLVVPLTALGGSAARLAASRRDARLSALRLAGATRGQVVAMTAIDAAMQALAGALSGIVGYIVLMPAIMQLRFQNRGFRFEELWVGPWALAATVAGVTLLALVSALSTLRRVAITPLGVLSRVTPPSPRRWRWIAAALLFAAAIIGFRLPQVQELFGLAFVIIMLVGCFAVVNLIGPLIVSTAARRKVRHPRNAATLIAMRRILDNPKRAWRNVSGVALAVFVAGITSVAAFLASGTAGGAGSRFLIDIGTGGALTLAFAAVLAAVSCGVMQAGNVYDQRDEYRMLMLEGTDRATLDRARMIEVMTPLRSVVVASAGCSLLLLFPLMGYMVMTAPVTVLAFAAGLAACFALVAVGVLASNRVAASIDPTGRRDD